MKIIAYPASDGDCVLMQTAGANVLVDGGRSSTFRDTALDDLIGRIDKGVLDLVCVSHIDADHISGIVTLLEARLAWRTFEAHEAAGDRDFPEPTVTRPPHFETIWHNGFHEQVAIPEADLDAHLGTVSAFTQCTDVGRQRWSYQSLATGVVEGYKLARLIEPDLANVTLNPPTGGELITTNSLPASSAVGDDVEVRVIGPTPHRLEELRADWERDVTEKARLIRDALSGLGTSAGPGLGDPLLPRTLAARQSVVNDLGDESDVTPPNVASLMMLCTDAQGHTVLFTGDGVSSEILEGLQRAGIVATEDDPFDIDVLKVQHHGAAANVTEDFCRSVRARHYLFCANGRHSNPEIEVVDAIIESRLSDQEPFTIWLTNNPDMAPPTGKRQLEAVVNRLADAKNRLGQRFDFTVSDGSPLEIRT